MAFFTCVVVSHNKPLTVLESINSVYNQTFTDWQMVIFDSGTLYDQNFFEQLPFLHDPRMVLARSTETDDIKHSKNITAWSFNESHRLNLTTGTYIVYLCDDDYLYPEAFQAYYDYYQKNPGVLAMYGSSDFSYNRPNGEIYRQYSINAEIIRGRCVGGGALDCQVDGGQICHHRTLFQELAKNYGNEYWPEDPAHRRHADGLFLERIGDITPIYPVPVKVAHNRKFANSTYDPAQ